MRNPLLFLIVCCLLVSCQTDSAPPSFPYQINATLSGFPDGTKFKLLNLDRSLFIDSTVLLNGALQFEGMTDQPFMARLHTINGKFLVLWVEPGTITINGHYEGYQYASIQGTPTNQVMVKYRDKQRILEEKRDALTNTMLSLMSEETEEAKTQFDSLKPIIENVDQRLLSIRKKSIEIETPSLYTLKELFFLRNNYPKDSIKILFDQFPEDLKSSNIGKVLFIYVADKMVKKGDHYADITGLDLKGKKVSLSSMEGKYILLDFWASWCGPCRKEHPNLVRLYQDFGGDQFEIFSFSVDNNADAWKIAVAKDGLTWTNVIDELGMTSEMPALYGVRAIPASFLINPDGKIIEQHLRGQQLRGRLEGLLR